MIHLVPRYRGARLVVAASLLLVLVPSAAFGSDDEIPPPVQVEVDVEDPDCHTDDHNIECQQPATSKIVITEIMQNPSMVWDSLGEWFEIYNAGSKSVDLAGWAITDELSNHHVIAGSLVIGQGEYLTIGRNSNSATNGGVTVGYSTGSDIFLFNSSTGLCCAMIGTARSIVSFGTTAPRSQIRTVPRCRWPT